MFVSSLFFRKLNDQVGLNRCMRHHRSIICHLHLTQTCYLQKQWVLLLTKFIFISLWCEVRICVVLSFGSVCLANFLSFTETFYKSFWTENQNHRQDYKNHLNIYNGKCKVLFQSPAFKIALAKTTMMCNLATEPFETKSKRKKK